MRKLTAFCLGAVCAIALGQAPGPKKGNPEQKKQAAKWTKVMGRGEGTLKPGEPAPDFELPKLRSEQKVRLSQFRGRRPVALVFASYT